MKKWNPIFLGCLVALLIIILDIILGNIQSSLFDQIFNPDKNSYQFLIDLIGGRYDWFSNLGFMIRILLESVTIFFLLILFQKHIDFEKTYLKKYLLSFL